MSSQMLLRGLLRCGNIKLAGVRHSSTSSLSVYTDVIGKREIVGFGVNGVPMYVDRVDFPMPAIRYKEDTPDILTLRQKEKGDWKKLALAEKKALYRASFGQTFAEINAPDGEWKTILGLVLIFMSASVWAYMGMRLFIYGVDMPESFNLENQQAQLKRMLDMRVGPIEGLSSKWDYENQRWK